MLDASCAAEGLRRGSGGEQRVWIDVRELRVLDMAGKQVQNLEEGTHVPPKMCPRLRSTLKLDFDGLRRTHAHKPGVQTRSLYCTVIPASTSHRGTLVCSSQEKPCVWHALSKIA